MKNSNMDEPSVCSGVCLAHRTRKRARLLLALREPELPEEPMGCLVRFARPAKPPSSSSDGISVSLLWSGRGSSGLSSDLQSGETWGLECLVGGLTAHAKEGVVEATGVSLPADSVSV